MECGSRRRMSSSRRNQSRHLALALHELATNAVKYGAPAAGRAIGGDLAGRVRSSGERRLMLHWQESGKRGSYPLRPGLWYEPHLERLHEDAITRRADLIQL